MRKLRYAMPSLAECSIECGKHLNLHRCIAHMILTSQYMGDAHFDVVDGTRQHVEPAPVGPPDHRV